MIKTSSKFFVQRKFTQPKWDEIPRGLLAYTDAGRKEQEKFNEKWQNAPSARTRKLGVNYVISNDRVFVFCRGIFYSIGMSLSERRTESFCLSSQILSFMDFGILALRFCFLYLVSSTGFLY